MSTVLLVGFPNSGKSTIFNLLSGMERKVSNYSGITVDAGIGELKSNSENQDQIQIVDLPGVYGLLPSSFDEAITVSTLLGLNERISEYQSIAVVVDFSRFGPSLSLVFALKDIVGPERLIVLVNKSDLREKGLQISWNKLEEAIGVRVFAFSAIEGENVQELDKFIRAHIPHGKASPIKNLPLTPRALEQFPIPPHQTAPYDLILNEGEVISQIERYQRQARELAESLSAQIDSSKLQKTYLIDKVLLHPLWGTLIFFATFYFIFHAIYSWAAPLMDFMEGVVLWVGEGVGQYLPEGILKSLVVDGIFAGVGGVVVFLPQIMMLFFLLSLLEQSGYIARAAFMSDRVMASFGLGGRAFLPYLSGFACAIPGIMASRSIPNFKERMATLLTVPLVTCSARLPVYVLLVGTFVPAQTVLGFLHTQALAFFFLYFLGGFVALAMAKLFRLSLFKGPTQSFFMEMPLYQRPSLKVAIRQMNKKGMLFLKKAGTVILALSILIWVLSTFPKPPAEQLATMSEQEQSAYSLEYSAMGRLGKAIEPAIRPLGYDWKIGVGLLVAFGARELFVSALGTIYALGEVGEDSKSLRDRILIEKDALTGAPIYNTAVAWSLLVFFAFACQCVSTLAVVRKETNSLKWPFFMFVYMGTIAYLGAFLTYRLLL